MAGPETRFIHECTYTPVHGAVTRDGRPFKPAQPLLKLAVLRTAFDDPDMAALVLGGLRTGDTPPPTRDLDGAVRAMLAGDTRAAASAVRHVALAEVVAFAEHAVAAERQLLTSATSAADEALVALASRRGETIRKLAITRSDVPALDAELARTMAPAGAAPADPDDIDDVDLTDRATADSAPADPDDLDDVGPAAGDLHSEIAARQPGVATVLGGRLFSFAKPLEPLVLKDQLALRVFGVLARYVSAYKSAALRAVSVLGDIEPVGYLHLERLQFTPVGYQRGELVYSLPMLPGETVRLTHREWSRTEEEYTRLVADSLERVAENALSEKSELTESFSIQDQQANSFNASTSVSGGFGPISISTTIGFGAQSSRARSEQSSAKRAQEITRKAASRSKEEHKITFRVASIREEEQVSFREIANPLERAVRWDFHRLMKKWQIDLYRYDVRLTYDIVIPEPGSYLLRTYARLAELDEFIARPFATNLSPASVGPGNWRWLAKLYDVSLEPPPPRYQTVFGHTEVVYSEPNVGVGVIEIPVPQGYVFRRIVLPGQRYRIFNKDNPSEIFAEIEPLVPLNRAKLATTRGDIGIFPWQYQYEWRDPTPKGSTLGFTVGIVLERSSDALRAWQAQCYERLLDATRVAYEARIQRYQVERDRIVEGLGRRDVLTLRKIEREEVMKGVLRWMLGLEFEFFPGEGDPAFPGSRPPDLDVDDSGDLAYYSASSGRVRERYRKLLLRHGDHIRFLHHAIEWENVNYVLYPYFWTDPDRWSFKQAVVHPDPQHETFLRSGAARVVLTIRRELEEAFLAYMESGRLDEALATDSEYFSVAQELKTMAETNYPYTPGANEEDPRNRVDTWFEFTPTGALDVVEGKTLDDA